MMRPLIQNVLLFATLTLIGCGGSDGPKTTPLDQVRMNELLELGDLLKTLAADNKKPPAKLADFAEVEPMIPGAGPAIRNGEVIYLWGSGYVANGTVVVAHEKNAPNSGGYVLLQNGTVKQMTADEFKTATKAKK
jgi:hypothetical protein